MIFTHYQISKQIEELGTLLQEVQKNPDDYSELEMDCPNYMEAVSTIYVLNKLCSLCHKNMKVEDSNHRRAKFQLAFEHVLDNTEILDNSVIDVRFCPDVSIRYRKIAITKEKLLTSIWIAGNELPNFYNLLYQSLLTYDSICIDLSGVGDYIHMQELSKYLKAIKKHFDYILEIFKTLLKDMSSNLKSINGK